MKKLFTLFAVAVLAFAAQANELTVADGDARNAYIPIDGLYVDTEGTLSQSIYPAEMLTDMVGSKISQLKFYPEVVNFYGATLEVSFKVVDQDYYTDAVAVTGATPVATISPAQYDTEIIVTLDEPFEYNGGNLMIETKVIETGTWRTTFFTGMTTENRVSYHYYRGWYENNELYAFLPKATFTYEVDDVPPTPPTPTEETAAPTFNGYTTDGIHAYFVEINETEPSDIYYRIQFPDGTWTDWALYEEILSFTGNGKYRVEAYAVAPGKLPSTQIAYEFVVSPFTGISEMAADKAVASVRYFNMAGQEMQQANGMTIVVTTYTDGTYSSVKVVK